MQRERKTSFSLSASLSLFSALTLFSHAHLWSLKLSLKMRVSSNELFSTLKTVFQIIVWVRDGAKIWLLRVVMGLGVYF